MARLVASLLSLARLRPQRASAVSLAALWLLLVSSSSVVAQELDRARQQLFNGEYSACIETCAEGVEANVFSQRWPLLKIRVEMAVGRYADALSTLEDALDSFPKSIRLRLVGADVLRFNGDLTGAMDLERELERLYDRSTWRYRDAANQVAIGRYLVKRGADAKAVLESFFNPVKADEPDLVQVYTAIGKLALAKSDYELAARHYRRAIELEPNNPDHHFGLAQALARSDAAASHRAMQKALGINPRHLPSLLSVVDYAIDAESYDEAASTIEKILKINPHCPEAWAYRAVLAHLDNDPEREKECRDRALAHWQANPRVDHLIGKKLSRKYRFAEGAHYQRRALIFDEDFTPAKIQLAQDELRLGNELKGWELADEVYAADRYNVVAHNLVTLRDELSDFRSIESDGFLVRMDPLEAELYGERVLALLRDARQLLADKYEVEIESTVTVEIFPRQQDFAIRTFGIPGGDGFLGVCFGNVITMNSPAAQGSNLTSWESVLWHEFCHVVTLQKTNNRMPRWLSEGISVYEERLANPAWGQSMTPRYREMVLSDDLTPVSELSGAFLQPESGEHLQFAYYESSLVVEYLIEEYGLDIFKRVLDDLGMGMPINETLTRYTGSMKLLDREFAEFARARAKSLVEQGEFTVPELPAQLTPSGLAELLAKHPNNVPLWQQRAEYLVAEKEWDQAIEACQKLIDMDASFPGANNPHRLLAEVYRARGEPAKEKQALQNYFRIDNDALEPIQRLLELSEQSGEWEQVIEYARDYLAVNPLIPLGHRYLSKAALKTERYGLAVESLQALIALDPLDPAEAYYQLARAQRELGASDRARRAVLQALEEAPRFRRAHRLLLELVKASDRGAE